jgi:hypothetical protein
MTIYTHTFSYIVTILNKNLEYENRILTESSAERHTFELILKRQNTKL